MSIVGIILAVIVTLMVIGSILRATYFQRRFDRIQPYGELVQVEDGQMHVYAMGEGSQVIVLLPGMGVMLPSADFGPLMRELSTDYTVVCVEYFGQGFSSGTSRTRTSANYVEEVRLALRGAGYTAPYLLMPHSISSVYSEYYAATYPDEVAGIISLDGTTTAMYDKMPGIVKFILPVVKFQQAIGTTAVLAPLTARRTYLLDNGYTAREIDDMISFGGFFMNDTVLAQIANSAEFIRETMGIPFPATVPFFKVVARQTYETPNSQLKKMGITPQQYQEQHLARVGAHAGYEILDGTHFIYVNNRSRIHEITDEMVKQL